MCLALSHQGLPLVGLQPTYEMYCFSGRLEDEKSGEPLPTQGF